MPSNSLTALTFALRLTAASETAEARRNKTYKVEKTPHPVTRFHSQQGVRINPLTVQSAFPRLPSIARRAKEGSLLPCGESYPLNPTSLCAPSQKGLFFDAPHRHRV